MASSLAVEWATKGVRVNALRYGAMRLASNRTGYFRHGAETSSHPSPSPGYMMTKLTRTILSNNPELKVALLLH
jgi:NAD(P)-dependent dehydrogenase (short-subunit alcohol dehydrogenase family)